jgi:predicted transcriptional regulator
MSELIRVSKEIKKKLVKLAAEIQQEKGEKVSLNYAIDFLIDF